MAFIRHMYYKFFKVRHAYRLLFTRALEWRRCVVMDLFQHLFRLSLETVTKRNGKNTGATLNFLSNQVTQRKSNKVRKAKFGCFKSKLGIYRFEIKRIISTINVINSISVFKINLIRELVQISVQLLDQDRFTQFVNPIGIGHFVTSRKV